MKLHKQIKIEAACSKDKDRMAINSPYLDRKDTVDKLVSTNGRILAVVPVECVDSDTAGHVPVSCLKDARKLGWVDLGETAKVGGTSHQRNPEEWEFPNWRFVIPNNSGKKFIRLAIDPSFLKDLADAMGTAGVALEIPVGDYPDGTSRDDGFIDPIVVRPVAARGIEPAANGAMGVIMPLRIS